MSGPRYGSRRSEAPAPSDTQRVSAPGIAGPSPAEFVGRAVAFGLLAVAGIAAVVLAGTWWASCIAAAGLLCAVSGLVASVVALLADEPAASWRTSRLTVLTFGTLSLLAIVVALTAA